MPGSHHEMWRNNKVCVKDELMWDCNPREHIPANDTHPSMPAMPKGPDHCRRCFMMGSEIGCVDCDDGMYLEMYSGMCMKKEEHHEEK